MKHLLDCAAGAIDKIDEGFKSNSELEGLAEKLVKVWDKDIDERYAVYPCRGGYGDGSPREAFV